MALTKQIARNGTVGARPKKSLARFTATRPGKKFLFKKKGSLKKSGRSKYKSENVLERKLRSWQRTRVIIRARNMQLALRMRTETAAFTPDRPTSSKTKGLGKSERGTVTGQ
nr:hypothetical protein LTR18_007119 [Exophiala xenobiotica]